MLMSGNFAYVSMLVARLSLNEVNNTKNSIKSSVCKFTRSSRGPEIVEIKN